MHFCLHDITLILSLCAKFYDLSRLQHHAEARLDRAEQQKQEQERARDRRPDITTR